MLPIRILVRTKADWRRMDRATFARQNDPTLPVPWIRFATLKNALDLWNQAFPMEFFEYRARLQELAFGTLERTQVHAITFGFEDLGAWLDDRQDEIIVPIDDDDFFRADLGRISELFDENTAIVIWPFVQMGFFGESRSRGFQVLPMRVLASNNWAARKSFLRRFAISDLKEMLSHHPIANQRVAADLQIPESAPQIHGHRDLGHPAVRVCREHLGLYNAHVGSIFFLSQAAKREDAVQYLRSLDVTTPMEIPSYASGFAPDIRRFEAVWG